MTRSCRYWIIVQDFKQGAQPVLHTLAYEIKWSSGWSGYEPQYSKKHFIEKIGPFKTRDEMLLYHSANKSKLLGGNNARISDMSDREFPGDCADQV